MDALVRAVPAGDVAELAADAQRLVDPRDDLVVQVQVLPLRHLRQALAAKIVERCKSLLVHPVGEAVDHLLDDAVAVVHHRRAYLHRAAAQQQKLRRILPVADAADAGEGNRRAIDSVRHAPAESCSARWA